MPQTGCHERSDLTDRLLHCSLGDKAATMWRMLNPPVPNPREATFANMSPFLRADAF